MAQRIRGQEVKVFVLVNGDTNTSLTDVRNFEVTPKFTKLEEGYLGETSKRYDEIFEGLDFSLELHTEDPGVLDFISVVRERAVDRTSKTVINIQSLLQFANGSQRNVILKDCYFENMPINVGGRSEYVSLKLAGSCSDFETI